MRRDQSATQPFEEPIGLPIPKIWASETTIWLRTDHVSARNAKLTVKIGEFAVFFKTP